MSTSKHSPGPWRLQKHREGCFYIEADQGKNWNNPTICHLYDDVTPEYSVTICDWLEPFENAKANGALMAASPELLDKLREYVNYFSSYDMEGDFPEFQIMKKESQEVIAKAEGRTV